MKRLWATAVPLLVLGSPSLPSIAQDMPIQPVFNGAIINGPGIMAMGLGLRPDDEERVCGRAYSNDLEKARLKRLEASGKCGAAVAPSPFASLKSPNLRPGTSSTVPSELEALRFAASRERRRTDYAQFIEKNRQTDPAGADNLAANLASDPIAQMGPELAKYGLRTDNVADAYTVYWTEAWEAAHGVTSEGSREQAQAVKQQAASAILATPEFARASDAQKQEFADALLVQALLIGAAKDQAHGDQSKLRQIATAVRQGARATGLDLDAMTLTGHGFVSAGAASPAPEPGTPR